MNAKQITVLIADDTPLAREGLRRILETSNDINVVGEVVTAHEVSRKVLDLEPDILLADLKWLGDGTAGWMVIRDAKLAFPSIKIIAITAYEHLIQDARLAGADATLIKTFTRDDLLSLIRVLGSPTNN